MKGSSLVLLSMLLTNLCASVALAEAPVDASKLQEGATALVNKQIVQPLKRSEAKRKRFSRDPEPPKSRRVRVLDAEAQTDAHGEQFVRFAVDALFRWEEDGKWTEDVYVGCVYLEQRAVFVQQESGYTPASRALMGEDDARLDVCRAAPPEVAPPAPIAAPAG